MAIKKDISGKTYGMLTVVGYSHTDGWKQYWNCICSCNPKKIIKRRREQITRAMFPSCGCWQRKENSYSQRKRKKDNFLRIENGIGVGNLTNGKVFYFDEEDFDKINLFTWRDDGKEYGRTVVRRSGKSIKIAMHRLVMLFPKGKFIDHINGNTLDNRKSNLRVVTNAENQQNLFHKQKSKTSKYIGVYFNSRSRKWKASIRHNGSRFYLGYFETEKDAALAYNKKSMELGHLTMNTIED